MNSATELELQRWSRSLRGAPVVWVSALLVLATATILWLRGAGFYALSLPERVDHFDYELLSPGRPTGRAYGWVGASLIALNLAYLLRRLAPRTPLGGMRFWLDVHVVTGLTGGLFVAFHSAFQLRSPVAVVMAAALAITLGTGLVGRFIYVFVPCDGSACLSRVADLDALLPGVGKPLIMGLGRLAPRAVSAEVGLIAALCALPAWLRQASARRALVRTLCAPRLAGLNAMERSYLTPLVRELASHAARQVYGVAGRELLRVWRPWHRACALTMVACVVLHVGVALFYGYAWDFDR
jgi:hypothetical protein